jgi:hypothetical protein
MPTSFWSGKRKHKRTSRPERSQKRLFFKSRPHETLETLHMLASDIGAVGFSANSSLEWKLVYEFFGDSATPFAVAIHQSPDGSALGPLVATLPVDDPAKLAGGAAHTLTLPPQLYDSAVCGSFLHQQEIHQS